jgi:succinate-semialdehyde dehydrogenase/glutarate-semialdehyde dehydrogenase
MTAEQLPTTADHVAMPAEHLAMYVDGGWCDAEAGETFDAWSPATGEVFATIAKGGRSDAQRAVAAAKAGQHGWAKLSAFERAAALERVGERLHERRERLAQALTRDQGKPISEARGEVEELLVYFKMATAEATRLEGLILPSVDAAKRVLVYRVPRGVVAVITPWNWPYTMAGEVIAPALAAGNAVVWNPASNTSACSLEMARCLADADLPPGVFNVVTGPGSVVGDELAGHRDVAAIGFVGSVEAGKKVAVRGAGKDLLLELGGDGPLVVLDDADLDLAVEATLTACYLNAGQSCTAGERILVQRSVHDAFVERLEAAVAGRIRLGDPSDEATTMGPVNNEAQAAKTDAHVQDAVAGGARVLAGGRRASGFPTPLYYEPTVLVGVTDDMAIARDETFGPVAPVTVIESEADALRIVNDSPFGLLAAVFTRDLGRGLRFAESVRTGWVNINEGTNYWESHLPFGGGAGADSGVGRVGGRFSMERLTELKTVVVNLG